MAYGSNFSTERMNKAKLFYNGVIFQVLNCLVSVSLCYLYPEIQLVMCNFTSFNQCKKNLLHWIFMAGHSEHSTPSPSKKHRALLQGILILSLIKCL